MNAVSSSGTKNQNSQAPEKFPNLRTAPVWGHRGRQPLGGGLLPRGGLGSGEQKYSMSADADFQCDRETQLIWAPGAAVKWPRLGRAGATPLFKEIVQKKHDRLDLGCLSER
jgi:hypothetical protein